MENKLDQLAEEFRGSPFWGLLGIELKEMDEGFAKTQLLIQPSHLNVNKGLHGGVYASILDSTMGIASRSLGFDGAVTLQMNVQFLGTVEHGLIYAESKVVHQTKSTVLVEGKLFDQQSNVLAYSTATFKMFRRDE